MSYSFRINCVYPARRSDGILVYKLPLIPRYTIFVYRSFTGTVVPQAYD